MRHFLNLIDLTGDEITELLEDALRLKTALRRGDRPQLLPGRVLGLVFEKPSLRTRVSFESAMAQLGGGSVFLGTSDGALGVRESVPDYARTLSGYVDAVVLRVFKHSTVEEFAAHATVPVINGLSDWNHPCQALADLLTLRELLGPLPGHTLVFVGDGNNVARSLAVGCGKLGVRFVLAAPDGYGFDDAFLSDFRRRVPQGELVMNGVPAHAVGDADIVYTDVWTSMGQEAEREQRLREFAAYQVNEELLALAPAHTRVMHCLPAHRGEEVSATILDGPRSACFQQAENRMHAQKALLKWLLT
jgi:ornithine carbamoyltransferase